MVFHQLLALWCNPFTLSTTKDRAALNKLIQPRVFSSCSNDKCRVLTIMWTRLQAPPSTAQQWYPNHFVPCVKTSLISPSQPSHFPYAKAQQPNPFKSTVTNSCPKLSTILLSRQCGGKSMRKFPNLKATLTTKSRFYHLHVRTNHFLSPYLLGQITA